MYEQPFNPYAANVAVVKSYFKQTKVLVLGVLYVFSAVLGVIGTVISAATPALSVNEILEYLNRMGIDTSRLNIPQMSDVTAASSSTNIFSIVISAAVTLLIATAFILMYVKSRSESPESNPSAGVSIMYVLSVISLVFMIIGTVLAVLGSLLLMYLTVNVNNYSGQSIDLGNGQRFYIDGPVFTALFIILIVVILGAVIYGLISVISQKRFYSSVKTSLNSVELESRGAKAYGVICVIDSVFMILAFIGNIFNLIGLSSLGLPGVSGGAVILSLISLAVSIAIRINLAMVALGYKKHIDKIKYGYNGNQPPFNGVPTYDNTPRPPYTAPQQPYSAPQQPYRPQPPQRPYNDGFGGAQPPRQQPYNDGFGNQPRQQAPAVCPKCGAPADGSPFCGNCGTKL